MVNQSMVGILPPPDVPPDGLGLRWVGGGTTLVGSHIAFVTEN